MTFLNETKPPLDEALMHYGVPGMRWGQRRADRKAGQMLRKQLSSDDFDDFGEDRKAARNKKIATGLLVGAGVIATGAILAKNGNIKLPMDAIRSVRNNSRAERQRGKDALRGAARKVRDTGNEYDQAAGEAGRRVYDAYKNSNFAKRTFEPRNTGNPIFNVTTMNRGSSRVRNFDPNIWDVPMLEITSGRR